MVLPLIGGILGSALGGAGLVGGLGALGAGAIGSGLGSLAQGDNLETAIGTGISSYFGGKLLGPAFTKAGIGSSGSSSLPAMQQGVPGAEKLAAGTLSNVAQQAISPQALATGASSAISSSMNRPPEPMKSKFNNEKIEFLDPANRQLMTPSPDYRPGFDPEFKYFRNFKGGGIADLMEMQEGGEMASEPNDKELIADAVEAIKGTEPNPEAALARFVAKYGEEALRELVDKVMAGEFDANSGITEGMLNGVGDGMDDMIPATLEGQQDVVLSDGEFIVPADVVSGIGNGSSDAGSEELYNMMDRVRAMRTGTTEQPEQVPLERMMPA